MQNIAAIAIDVLQDAFWDTLYLVPFLFIAYLFMEWIEHKTGERTQSAIARAGKAGPIIGAILGIIPQCGFSASASTLYAGRVIGLGTLFAVYLSTSDEMLPIFFAEQIPAQTIIGILCLKAIIGMLCGLFIDTLWHATKHPQEPFRIHELCEQDQCNCSHDCETCRKNPELAYDHCDDCAAGCDHLHHVHNHARDKYWGSIVQSALRHTVQVVLFVFFVSLAIAVGLEFVGEDTLKTFLHSNGELAILGSVILGLIPNCAASVAITQLYVEGVIEFSACMAGLLSAAGVGILVLFRANRRLADNIRIVATLALVSALCGFVIRLTGFTL